ncbi:MAG TPA: hypothetical protein VFT10_02975 [Solirubrobacterales bacterium]|nr:hypothetical protein [Solirubrobacterales bacterium]
MSIYRSDPAAPGANVRRRQVDTVDERLDHTVDRFNASEAARTVAGLTRSLGRPFVSVGAAAGSPNEVRITVAWELCWYQWGVDLADERRPVFEIGKGSELEQLDRSARQWNAGMGEGAQLVIGLRRR